MAVERGQVTKTGNTQNGKPWLEISGKRYFAGRCDVSGVRQGQTIEFEWNEFGEPHPRYGRSRGLQNWAFVNSPATPSAPSGNLDDQDRPAISNWVAHAIAAGLIKSPTDLKGWALASQEALQALKSAKPAPRAPVSNGSRSGDDMPPYDDMLPYDDGPPLEELPGSW